MKKFRSQKEIDSYFSLARKRAVDDKKIELHNVLLDIAANERDAVIFLAIEKAAKMLNNADVPIYGRIFIEHK